MKALKYYLSAILLVTAFWSCTNTEDFGTADFVNTAVAPSNVSALFNVTQDNTGLVTITPNGEGVISYQVVFGDNSDSATVKQGENVQHTYAEGSYEVKITAIGITGLKTEVTKPLVVSFKAPENLAVTIENDVAVSKQVNVTATADYGLNYDVYFGEPGNDTPVTGNIGETVSYVYQNAGTYTIRVVAKSAAIATAEYSEDFLVTAILQPLNSAPKPFSRNEEDVISIFSDAYTNVAGTDYFPDWGQGGQGSSWAMFDLQGDSMLQYINLSYQGIQFGSAVDASGMEMLHIDVWTADVTGIDIFPIDGNGAAEKFVHRDLVADQWNSFDIPLTEFTDQGLPLNNVIQFKFVGTPWAGGTVFMDNLFFYKEPSNTAEALLHDDFEGNGNISTWFGDACGLDTAFANPFQDSFNNSATVLEYNDDGSGAYANVRFDTSSNFDLQANSKFTLKIYVPSSGITGSQNNQISLKLQDGTAAEPWTTQTEIIKNIVLDQWQEVSFDFANDAYLNWSTITTVPVDRTDLNRVVIQVNGEGNNDSVVAYIDDFSFGTVADTPPYAVDDFEGSGTIDTWFGDACGLDNAFVNPFQDSYNNSATVLEYSDDGSGAYANVRFDVTPNFDLTAKSKFTLKIYVPSSGITGSQNNQISLKLQDGTAAEPWTTQTEIIKNIVLDQWQELTFDFVNDTYVNWSTITTAPIDRIDLNRVVIQVNGEGNNDSVVAYIDDFNYHK